MMRYRTCALALLVAMAAIHPRALAAQPPPEPQPVEVPSPPVVTASDAGDDFRREVFRLGTDYTLRSGDAVREVVVVLGNATIEGHVRGGVVVVLGTATLSSTASIGRDFVVVGGSAVVSPSARVGGDLVVVAGGVDAPPDFAPQGQQVIIGSSALGGQLGALSSWLIRGVLLGRPIVPDLLWVWAVVGVFFLIYFVLNLLFDRSIGTCAETLGRKPLTTFGTGLLVLLLLGPVCLLLTVSVVGIAVVPVVLCALLVGGVLGKVGVARWIGRSILPESEPERRSQSIRSFAIGFAVIGIAYMIPLLGFVTWTLTSVLGIGAATLAFFSAYRRENPPPEHPVPLVVPPVAQATASPAWEGEAPTVPLPRPSVTAAPIAVADVVALPRAAFRDRFLAFVLDIILVFIAYQFLNRFGDDGEFFFWLLAYHIGFWTWKGTTVGGIICQLRVVRVDGTAVRFVDALVRGLSSIFSLAVLGIGCLWILKDPERQAWHDRIAGTYVVKVPRNWPL